MREAKKYRKSVEAALPHAFRSGGTVPELSRYEVPNDDLADIDGRVKSIDTELLGRLLSEATSRDFADASEMDGWFAPRLHAALRLTRRVACDRGFWAWLTINWANEYVQRRWSNSSNEPVLAWRYSGDLLRNSLSRLWWGAELARDGADYREVPRVFRRVRTAQFALELKYSWYRPAVIAFSRVVQPDHGPALSDDETKNLSRRANAYLGTLCLEAMAPQEGDEGIDVGWHQACPLEADILEGEPKGPGDSKVSSDAIRALEGWFSELAGIKNDTE